MNRYKVSYLIGYKTPWERTEERVIIAERVEMAKKKAYMNAPFHLKHKFIKVRRIFGK